jgi:hypothetical protein
LINNRNAGRRRGRGGQRQQGGGGGGGRQESGNRIDNRARGNANQLLEKYKNLAADAQRQGDRVNTEYYLQFADHYFRVLADNRARFEEANPQARRQREEAEAAAAAAEDGYDDDIDTDGETGGDRREAREGRWNGNREASPRRDEVDASSDGDTRNDGEDDGDGWRRNRRGRNRNRSDEARADDRGAEDANGNDGRLAAAVLPPSIQVGVEGEPARDDELPPAPRRRGRPRKTEQATEAAAE